MPTKTPFISVRFMYLEKYELYCIFEPYFIIYVLLSIKCILFHNLPFSVDTVPTTVIYHVLKFKYQHCCLKKKFYRHSITPPSYLTSCEGRIRFTAPVTLLHQPLAVNWLFPLKLTNWEHSVAIVPPHFQESSPRPSPPSLFSFTFFLIYFIFLRFLYLTTFYCCFPPPSFVLLSYSSSHYATHIPRNLSHPVKTTSLFCTTVKPSGAWNLSKFSFYLTENILLLYYKRPAD
jgi:hypothetical protein